MNNTLSQILIVDDNPDDLNLLAMQLRRANYIVLEAETGENCLTLLNQIKPDLILLDVMMPKLSGFEACERLKSEPATSRIMILMVTALNEHGDIERAVQAGADDFISKPVHKLELLRRIDRMLKLRHITDENERLRRYIEEMEDRG